MLPRILALSALVLCAACSEKPTATSQTTASATASAKPVVSAAPVVSVPAPVASVPAPPAPAEVTCGRPAQPGKGCVYPKSKYKACEENWKRQLTGCAPDAETKDRCDDKFVGYCKYGSGLVTYFYGKMKAGDRTLEDGCKSAGGLFCTE